MQIVYINLVLAGWLALICLLTFLALIGLAWIGLAWIGLAWIGLCLIWPCYDCVP